MFKKLRNKFLFLNLVTISVMMLLAFSSIYFITYQNVQTEINMELHRLSENNRKPLKPSQQKPDYDEVRPHSERSISFTIITDLQWNKSATSSVFDMDDEFYEWAKKAVQSKNTNQGKFKLDDTYWAFMIKPLHDGFQIVFLDVTSQQGILTTLVYTFLISLLVLLAIIYFISRMFANRAIKPVKEAFDKQKQFIADASHELKTPLAVINTNADVLLSNMEDRIENQSKWLYYIKSETERMTKLTNDLLYLTQVDYSDQKMISAHFNLSETVENVLLTMEAVIFENTIDLHYDIEPDLFIQGNREQLQQVAMILLDNAVKYTNPNGKISILLKRNHNILLLSITNTGEGIPQESLFKIFDRFYRTDKSRERKNGSYGLGLSIAKAIIEQHGGKITAKSVLNESTTFTIQLPLMGKT